MIKRMNIYVFIILCCALSLLISYFYHNSNDNYKIMNKLSNIFLQLNKNIELFKSNYIIVPSSIISLNNSGFYSFQQYLMKQGIQLPQNISFDIDYNIIVNEYFEHINTIVPEYFNKTATGRMNFLNYINSTNRMKLLEYINNTSSNVNLVEYFNTTSLNLRGYYNASLDLQDYYYKAAQNFSLYRAFNTSVSSSSSLSYSQLHEILNSTEKNINEYILEYIMHVNNHRIDSSSSSSSSLSTMKKNTSTTLPDKLEEKINKFQWIFYLKMNPDILLKSMITTHELALEHYIQKGYKQRRWSNPSEQPSEFACLLGKDVIPIQLFLKRCNYQQNLIIKNKLRSIIQQLHSGSSSNRSTSKKESDNQSMKDITSGDNSSISNNNSISSRSSSSSSDINNNNNHSLQHKLKVFDYKFYLKMNPDIVTAGILTKQRAIEHYKKSGYRRNRWSNPYEKPSLEACARVRKFLDAKEFSLYCNLFKTSSSSSSSVSTISTITTTTPSSSLLLSSSSTSSTNNNTDTTNKEIIHSITSNVIFPLDIIKAKIENLIQPKLLSSNSSSIMSNSSVDIIDSKPTTTTTSTIPIVSIITASSINVSAIKTVFNLKNNSKVMNNNVVVETKAQTNTTEILNFIDDSMDVPIPSNWTLQMSKGNSNHTGIFDWRFYLKFNPDLLIASITTEIQAKEHYHNYGSNEGRWSNAYELPTESACIRIIDVVPVEEFNKYCTYSIFNRETLHKRLNHRLSTFDWEFYLKYNPDLILLKLTTQQHAIAHYKRYGFYERRWSCSEEIPSISACIRAKALLITDEMIKKCSTDNNNNNDNNNGTIIIKNPYVIVNSEIFVKALNTTNTNQSAITYDKTLSMNKKDIVVDTIIPVNKGSSIIVIKNISSGNQVTTVEQISSINNTTTIKVNNNNNNSTAKVDINLQTSTINNVIIKVENSSTNKETQAITTTVKKKTASIQDEDIVQKKLNFNDIVTIKVSNSTMNNELSTNFQSSSVNEVTNKVGNSTFTKGDISIKHDNITLGVN